LDSALCTANEVAVVLKAEGAEEAGSQSYVPPDEKDDRALKEALDLLRGTITDAAFPPNPKAAVR
jgi:carboxyl-terminal processing protease